MSEGWITMKDEALHCLHTLARPEKIPVYLRFFKTAPGEYGEGDRFIGVTMPDIRKCLARFKSMPLDEAIELLYSPIHEERMFALLLLVAHYSDTKCPQHSKEEIFTLYIRHRAQINNWDLVDVTAPHIVGDYLLDRDKTLLYTLARSDRIWDKRIAMISTAAFIKKRRFEDALALAAILRHDPHDLIHKAVGWMLREIGKHDLEAELAFLYPCYREMPRTMLRYAIEKFDEPLRQCFLKGEA